MKSDEDLRVAVEGRLRRPVRPGSWQAMVDGGWVAEIVGAHGDDQRAFFEDFVEAYRRQERYARLDRQRARGRRPVDLPPGAELER